MDTELVGLGGVAGAAVVLAMVALIRQTLPIPDRFTGSLAVLVGIGLNIALRASAVATDVIEGVSEPSWTATILTGILAGLSATGLWEAGKAVQGGGGVDIIERRNGGNGG